MWNTAIYTIRWSCGCVCHGAVDHDDCLFQAPKACPGALAGGWSSPAAAAAASGGSPRRLALSAENGGRLDDRHIGAATQGISPVRERRNAASRNHAAAVVENRSRNGKLHPVQVSIVLKPNFYQFCECFIRVSS
jgi:hypothetical protein